MTLVETNEYNYVDGNAAAGPLQELLAVEPTTVRGQCANCGLTSMLADTRVYFGPGLVMRCWGCDTELLSIVTTPTATRLDVSGLTCLTFPIEA